jgi:hypothetical protein
LSWGSRNIVKMGRYKDKIENGNIPIEHGMAYHNLSILVGNMSKCAIEKNNIGWVENYCMGEAICKDLEEKYGQSQFSGEMWGTLNTAQYYSEMELEGMLK